MENNYDVYVEKRKDNGGKLINLFILHLDKGDFLSMVHDITVNTKSYGIDNHCDRLIIHLDSVGGDPDEYMSLLEYISFIKDVTTYVYGQCDSAAALFVLHLNPKTTFLAINTVFTFHAVRHSLERATLDGMVKYIEANKKREEMFFAPAITGGLFSKETVDKIFAGEEIIVDTKTMIELGFGTISEGHYKYTKDKGQP